MPFLSFGRSVGPRHDSECRTAIRHYDQTVTHVTFSYKPSEGVRQVVASLDYATPGGILTLGYRSR